MERKIKSSNKKNHKDLEVKINDVVTLRTLIDVTKDFLGDVNLEFKRDPEMEKEDKIQEDETNEKMQQNIKNEKLKQKIKIDDSLDDKNDKKSEEVPNKKGKNVTKKEVQTDEAPLNGNNNNNTNTNTNNGNPMGNQKRNEFYGIKIVAVNNSKSLIIVIKLDSKKFGTFKVSKPVYDVGINLMQLFKLIRSLDKDDILTMSIDSDDKHLLVLDVENEIRNCRTQNRLKTLDIDKKTYKIPDTKFDMVVKMESAEFHRVCKDLSLLSEYVEIICKENSITFTSTGDCSDKSITIDASKDNGVNIKPLVPGKGTIVQGIFELKYFTMFQKCSSLCPNIQIYLRNNYPIFIKYQIASLGQILVGIVPVNDKNVNNNNFSDEDEDYSDDEKIKVKGKKKDAKKDISDDEEESDVVDGDEY